MKEGWRERERSPTFKSCTQTISRRVLERSTSRNLPAQVRRTLSLLKADRAKRAPMESEE
eukprot:753785-Hanusia_phi.AAC.1